MRSYLYAKLDLSLHKRVLEVGCGTGAITSDLTKRFNASSFGLDLRLDFLHDAHLNDNYTKYSCGNVYALPFPDNSFDVVICHYFLLWVKDLSSALAEICRVTKKRGFVLALAEPDFGARIDYPEPLRDLGYWQIFALKRQGADPELGRKLMAEFQKIGLQNVESGLMGGEWRKNFDLDAFESEWKLLEADLSPYLSQDKLKGLRQIDEAAYRKGERILFVPTFYAIGMKPDTKH